MNTPSLLTLPYSERALWAWIDWWVFLKRRNLVFVLMLSMYYTVDYFYYTELNFLIVAHGRCRPRNAVRQDIEKGRDGFRSGKQNLGKVLCFVEVVYTASKVTCAFEPTAFAERVQVYISPFVTLRSQTIVDDYLIIPPLDLRTPFYHG